MIWSDEEGGPSRIKRRKEIRRTHTHTVRSKSPLFVPLEAALKTNGQISNRPVRGEVEKRSPTPPTSGSPGVGCEAGGRYQDTRPPALDLKPHNFEISEH